MLISLFHQLVVACFQLQETIRLKLKRVKLALTLHRAYESHKLKGHEFNDKNCSIAIKHAQSFINFWGHFILLWNKIVISVKSLKHVANYLFQFFLFMRISHIVIFLELYLQMYLDKSLWPQPVFIWLLTERLMIQTHSGTAIILI